MVRLFLSSSPLRMPESLTAFFFAFWVPEVEILKGEPVTSDLESQLSLLRTSVRFSFPSFHTLILSV